MRWNAEGQALCRERGGVPHSITGGRVGRATPAGKELRKGPRRQGRTEKEAIAISRIKALDYAERLINRPRGETPVAIRRNKNGYSLLYSGRVLTKTHASGVGEMQAQAMALALGIELPTEIGGETTTKVGSGVLYRAIGALVPRPPPPRGPRSPRTTPLHRRPPTRRLQHIGDWVGAQATGTSARKRSNSDGNNRSKSSALMPYTS